MTLQSSGAISLSNIASEMGGSTPHSLSEYYKGGGLVANHSNNPNVPTSGTISLSNFYGANNTAPGASSHNHALVVGNGGNTILGPVGFSKINTTYGSLSNNPQPSILTTGLRMDIQYAYWDLLCNKATFYMRYTALAGPTDGTGWSAINNGFDGNRTRSEYSITVNGSNIDLFALWPSQVGTGPSQGTTLNMVVSA